MGHSTTYDPKKNVLYMYGGCKYKKWFSDVNVLNLITWEWRTIKVPLYTVFFDMQDKLYLKV